MLKVRRLCVAGVITISILAQTNDMGLQLIKSTDLQLAGYKPIRQLEYNLAIIYIRPQEDYIIVPQKGEYSILVKSENELERIVQNDSFPLLEENKSIYSHETIAVENGNIIDKDTLLKKNIDYVEFFETDDIDENFIKSLNTKFSKLQKNQKEELFPQLLVFFGEFFKSKWPLDWVVEKEYFFNPISIPILYNHEWNISLYILNERLEELISKDKINFQNSLIDIYCHYYEKRFLSTGQANYFVSKEYKKLLKKNFNTYWKFPFINIWEKK